MGGDAAVEVEFEAFEHSDHELHSLGREVLVHFAVEQIRAGACVDEFCGAVEDSAVGVAEPEPAGVGGECDEEGFGDGWGERPTGVLNQVEDYFAGGGGGRVNKLDIAEGVAGYMVVDDEDLFSGIFQPLVEIGELDVAVCVDDDYEVAVVEVAGVELVFGDVIA